MSIRVFGPTILTDNTQGSRNIIISTGTPSSGDGRNGDVWFKYV